MNQTCLTTVSPKTPTVGEFSYPEKGLTRMLNIDIFENNGTLPRLLTALDVAKILNIGHSTVYQLIQRNEIPSVKIGRTVRIRIEDVENYILSNRTVA